MKPHSDDTARLPPAAPTWSRPLRVLASLLLAWHLLALLVGPWSVPPSVLASALRPIYRPYLEAAYLNHGYKFFGPDPGPSHLIRYDLELADGSRIRGSFPSLKEHWPRLLYHRHFMLSEFVNSLPADGPPDPRVPWEQQPLSAAEKAYVGSYADHLLNELHGERVTLDLVEHAIPAPADVLKGMKLDDPRLYRTRRLGTFIKQEPK